MTPQRQHLRVTGVVQGVGFRPFVFGLAEELGLTGHVGNDAHGVFIEVEGDAVVIAAFATRLRTDAPPLARIDEVAATELAPSGDVGFTIAPSAPGEHRTVLVSPDAATCEDCRREVADPTDRRYRYPFTNCTNCGPRYTIVRDVPYDRPATTMADFAMCDDCAREYADPRDRRFHAQPVCCPACGPRLRLLVAGTEIATADDALHAAADRLLAGEIVAVKGLGGFHLAVLASDETATAALRSRKHREDKPFALMVRDLDVAAALCNVDDLARDVLTDRARPIVLLPRRDDAAVAAAVAPGNRHLGLMLPYTPLHDLLLDAVGAPLVVTSANLSDEPIAYRDEDARERLTDIADAFLLHDRPIHIRVDDSVVRPVAGRPVMARRSRGYAPGAITLPVTSARHLLAVGAELKNTICVARGQHAFVSHHIGDLENYETFRSFTEAIDHLARLFDVRPDLVVHDLHPEYLSTKHAHDLHAGSEVELLGVQHHHAHIASCLADNDEVGPVVGIAFDGTGFGTDTTIWGGEILVADLRTYERVGHISTVPLPGGAAAIRNPWRMAAVHLDAAIGRDTGDLEVAQRNAEQWDQVLAVAAVGLNAPATSSAGRLFDAVAAILGLRDAITYEGQAAIELEQLADPTETGAYAFPTRRSEVADAPAQLDSAVLVRAVVADVREGAPLPLIAARFHNGVAAGVSALAAETARAHDLDTVALSGGVFQNALLTTRVIAALEAEGMRVLTHRQVPPNDGGISLGQAAVAAARGQAG